MSGPLAFLSKRSSSVVPPLLLRWFQRTTARLGAASSVTPANPVCWLGQRRASTLVVGWGCEAPQCP